jgi:hypothetical protein
VKLAHVTALRTSDASLVLGKRSDQASVLLVGYGCAIVGTLGLMHAGYFSTAWGWGSLLCFWLAGIVLLVSGRIWVGPLEVTFLSGLGAFIAFTAASSIWSVSPPAAIREVERGTLVLAAVLAAMLLARRHMRPLLGGVMGGIAIAGCYGLATRLFPTRLGSFDAIAGYRLAEPLGYWNALGIFAAIGVLLGLGFAARGRTLLARGFGSAIPVLLLPVMYFTFGRGAWVALGVGLVAAIALDRRRLQLISTILAIAPLGAVALWMCSREPDLNRRGAALGGAASEGRRLAFALVALTLGAALVGPTLQFAEGKIIVGRTLRHGYTAALVAVLLAALGIGFVRYGPPQDIASRAYNAFRAPPANVNSSGNLSKRLFSLSSNGRLTQWRVAIDDFRSHPWLGSGAGTYELSWLKDRPTPGKVRDAHNLYVEVLAELGPIGLALIVFALSVPIFGAIKARRHPLVPIALGAYLAYVVHAAVDWDWEMPAVTLAGLLCGVAILVVARPNAGGLVMSRRLRVAAVSATVALATFAFVALMGNLAIAASNNAATDSNWSSSASHARDAKRWMPWSSDPWRLQGEAQYVQGNFDAARANFRKAIDKDPNNWLLWADLATVGTHGTWRAPARRALALNPLAPELAEFRNALGRSKG